MSEFHQKALVIDVVGYLLIVDRDNHCVVVMRSRRHVRTFGKGHLSNQCGVSVNNTHQVFVIDRCHHRISVFDKYGSMTDSFGRKGRGQGELLHPSGVTVNPRTNQPRHRRGHGQQAHPGIRVRRLRAGVFGV